MDIDPQFWIIIIVAIASALGGLLKKKQEPDTETPPKPPKPGRPPTLPRPSRPPHPADVQREATPREPARTRAERQQVPRPPWAEARPATPAPKPLSTAERPGEIADRLRQRERHRRDEQALEHARRQPDRRTPLAAELDARAAEEAVRRSRERFADAADALSAHGRSQDALRIQLRGLLQRRSGQRLAIVMQEVLGPPRALRPFGEDR